MRARCIGLTSVLATVSEAMALTVTSPVPASACDQGSCNGVSAHTWGWTPWAQTGTTPPVASGGQGTTGRPAGGQAAPGSAGQAAPQPPADPCSYTQVAPDLVAQSCPGYTDLGTRAAKLIPVGPAPRAAARQAAAAKVTPLQLAERAAQNLVLPLPQLSTAPPRGSDGAVGLPEWFWLPAAQWTPRSARAQAGRIWAMVTARPRALTIDPGDGTGSFGCPGPGTRYDPAQSATGQSSDCTHLYQQPSVGRPGLAYQVTVTVRWTATWHGSGGTGGGLAPVARTATFGLRIAEGQALIPAEGS